MAGQFYVDKAGLRAAIGDLQAAHKELLRMQRDAASLNVGELTAGDQCTKHVVQNFTDRAAGKENSLASTVKTLADIVQSKIDAYKGTIAEYEKAEEHSTVHHGRIDV